MADDLAIGVIEALYWYSHAKGKWFSAFLSLSLREKLASTDRAGSARACPSPNDGDDAHGSLQQVRHPLAENSDFREKTSLFAYGDLPIRALSPPNAPRGSPARYAKQKSVRLVSWRPSAAAGDFVGAGELGRARPLRGRQ
jgi:hypothetical protein